jgi:hypothetical protein
MRALDFFFERGYAHACYTKAHIGYTAKRAHAVLAINGIEHQYSSMGLATPGGGCGRVGGEVLQWCSWRALAACRADESRLRQ